MPTSPYIHHYRDIGEQGLIQSITAETIFLGGRDVIYLPREDYNREDAIFGQATQLIFRKSVNVAMMLESTEGFEGEGEFYSKFGLDINRDFSCGNVVMEYASLSVPLIGNIKLDCQRIIYPNTSFEHTDYDNIKKCVKRLNEDRDFYKEVSSHARTKVEEKYHSSVVTKNFIKDLKELL